VLTSAQPDTRSADSARSWPSRLGTASSLLSAHRRCRGAPAADAGRRHRQGCPVREPWRQRRCVYRARDRSNLPRRPRMIRSLHRCIDLRRHVRPSSERFRAYQCCAQPASLRSAPAPTTAVACTLTAFCVSKTSLAASDAGRCATAAMASTAVEHADSAEAGAWSARAANSRRSLLRAGGREGISGRPACGRGKQPSLNVSLIELPSQVALRSSGGIASARGLQAPIWPARRSRFSSKPDGERRRSASASGRRARGCRSPRSDPGWCERNGRRA
jgi:hypothetical protein